MYARDIMTRPVVTTTPQTPLREALAVLLKNQFAALPVVDDDGHVIGVLSEGDPTASSLEDDATLVNAVMTTPVEVIQPGTAVGDIADRMASRRLRSLPVVERGLLVGIVTRRDVVRVIGDDDSRITSEIRALLDDYAGSRRHWDIEVSEGLATISGGFADREEEHLVSALARTVDGVRHVDILANTVLEAGHGA